MTFFRQNNTRNDSFVADEGRDSPCARQPERSTHCARQFSAEFSRTSNSICCPSPGRLVVDETSCPLAQIPVVAASRASIVAVIGVGYVGLHLAQTFSKAFQVKAFDVSDARITFLKNHHAMTNVTFTGAAGDLSDVDLFLISVPTQRRRKATPSMTITCVRQSK